MNHQIFLSYRRDDEGADTLMALLHRELERCFGDGTVFWDKQTLDPGKWSDQLRAAVRGASIVIPVIDNVEDWLGLLDQSELEPGADSARIDRADDWVRYEVGTGIQQAETDPENRLLVPLLIGGGRLPSEDRLPDDLKALPSFQAYTKLNRKQADWLDQLTPFAHWLARTRSLSLRRRELLRRLSFAVLGVEGEQIDRDRLEAFFRASLGSLFSHEALVQELPDYFQHRGGAYDLAARLGLLEAQPDQRPLLRFLTLILHHHTQHGVASLPPRVLDALREETERAKPKPGTGTSRAQAKADWQRRKDAGWEISASDYDQVVDWVCHGELRPVFQVAFLEGGWNSQTGTRELEVRGCLRWAGEILHLGIDPERIPWGEDAHLQQEGLCRVLLGIYRRAAEFLGLRVDQWRIDLHPRLEFFFQRNQTSWPIESIELPTLGRAGTVFRLNRRIFERHCDQPETWKVACENLRVQGNLAAGSWREVSQEDDLYRTFTVGCDCDAGAFWEALQAWTEGLWLRAGDPEAMAKLIHNVAETEELARVRRRKDGWEALVYLFDRSDVSEPPAPEALNRRAIIEDFGF